MGRNEESPNEKIEQYWNWDMRHLTNGRESTGIFFLFPLFFSYFLYFLDYLIAFNQSGSVLIIFVNGSPKN